MQKTADGSINGAKDGCLTVQHCLIAKNWTQVGHLGQRKLTSIYDLLYSNVLNPEENWSCMNNEKITLDFKTFD